jgi:D-alanyl-D-alanine carboxypeptidase
MPRFSRIFSLVIFPIVVSLVVLLLVSCSSDPSFNVEIAAAPPCTPQRYAGPTRATPPELATLSAAPITVPFSPEMQGRLDEAATRVLSATATPGMTAAVAIPGSGRWSATRGLARAEPAQPVADDTVFYWASVGKAATALVVLQLVDHGALRLDDRLDRWYPQAPNAAGITIANLLTHTSGLASNPTADPLAARYEPPEELLASLSIQVPAFCPGSGWLYSNVGYLLLGKIAEQVSGLPFHELVARAIATPLNLPTLRALRPGEMPPQLAISHDGRVPQPDLGISSRLGMGNIVARAEDVLVFWRAVLTGELLQSASARRQWEALYPMDGVLPWGQAWYGQGVMLVEWTDERQRKRTWLGHLGGTPHANAVVAYDPRAGAFVAVAVNSGTSSVAIAAELLKAIEMPGS